MTDDHTIDDVITRARKVVAVHAAYASRADQFGHRPPAPSYFLKPTSTLTVSGAEVDRPEGTELMGFEGEIAIVIGTSAKRVSIDDAWSHVRWVTASNDLGLHDFKHVDSGSTVRQKGRDRFTPIGPALLDAQTLDPTAIRVRSWLNGQLAQEDTTAGLLFPLAQVIADLSQHLTLESGDIILTGTPAGASVANPGDVVEVEVDAPTLPGHPTTGRLVTPFVDGPGAFDPALGSLPWVDDELRALVWGSREASGLESA